MSKVYSTPNGGLTTMLRGCVICEAYKYSEQMDYHRCPYWGKDSVSNFWGNVINL